MRECGVIVSLSNKGRTDREELQTQQQALPALWKEAEINVVNPMLAATFLLLGRGHQTYFACCLLRGIKGDLQRDRVFVCWIVEHQNGIYRVVSIPWSSF